MEYYLVQTLLLLLRDCFLKYKHFMILQFKRIMCYSINVSAHDIKQLSQRFYLHLDYFTVS